MIKYIKTKCTTNFVDTLYLLVLEIHEKKLPNCAYNATTRALHVLHSVDFRSAIAYSFPYSGAGVSSAADRTWQAIERWAAPLPPSHSCLVLGGRSLDDEAAVSGRQDKDAETLSVREIIRAQAHVVHASAHVRVTCGKRRIRIPGMCQNGAYQWSSISKRSTWKFHKKCGPRPQLRPTY